MTPHSRQVRERDHIVELWRANNSHHSRAGTGVGVPDLVVRFEIYIVKVPWVPGVPWTYKNMCSQILDELKL
jgi:Kinase associated domain 1